MPTIVTGHGDPLPSPIQATLADLPEPVAAALTHPEPAKVQLVPAGGRSWSCRAWGEPSEPPILLLHGVTSSSQAWWRVGPGLAASGRRVIAPDMPGHGRTGAWAGRHRFEETAADVAGLIRALDLDVATLPVIGHSWGAMTSAALPSVGVRPERLVLIDPPVMRDATIQAMLHDPIERPYDDLAEALAALRAAYPAWDGRDVEAKATALFELDPEAVRAVLVENGDWDGGLGALCDPAAAGIPVRVIRAQPAHGGLLDDDGAVRFGAVIGREHVTTIEGAPHSPHRTHPAATVMSLLAALEP